MSTNAAKTVTTVAPYRWVWFQTDRNGRKIAYGWGTRSHRGFRIGLAEAELMVATGQAPNIGHHPFQPCTETCGHQDGER